MRMNRRNVLVGLGTIVTGGGAALGTGAFSSVEADRTVKVTTAGDSSAFVSLEPNSNLNTSAVSNTDGTLEINLDDSFGTTNGTGVNYNATTTIGSGDSSSVSTAAFTITNNGDSPIDIDVTVKGDHPSHLALYAGDSSSSVDLTSSTYSSLGSGSSLDVAVVIDLTGVDKSNGWTSENIAREIQIIATATS